MDAWRFCFCASVLNDQFWDWLDNSNLALLVSALAFGLSIWGFVELFCLTRHARTEPVRSRSAGAARTGVRTRAHAGTSTASWNLCRTALAHRRARMLSGGMN